ncbi:MAG TPA: AAA family ATPase [Stellaceae bacterium]|nr:AAA family ATPase [Stellaceae bacterium]
MRLRNFTAPSMQEAMALVRQELGPEAIIVSTDDEPGGVRVTAALDEAEPRAPSTSDVDVTEQISEALGANGVPGPLAEKLLMASLSFDADDALVGLSGALAAVYSFAPIADQGRSRPLMLVGPPGAGKTMAVAKLAARAVMAKRRVSIVTSDTVRAGAVEQLAAVARILDVELETAESAGRLATITRGADPDTLTLIDSYGVNPYNAADRRELSALVVAAGAEPLLVLPAGGDALDAIDIARIFRDLGCSRMAVTRLDLTHRLGSVLAAADAARLGFAEAGVAPEIADGMIPFNPVVLARRLIAQTTLSPQQPLQKRGAS